MFLKAGQRIVMLSSAAIALAVTGASAYGADESSAIQEQPEGFRHSLRGEYAYTTVGFCVESGGQAPGTAGFDPTTLKLLAPGQIINLAGKGTLHFRQDGTLTLSGSAAWVLPAQTAVGSNPVLTNLKMSSTVGKYVLGANGAISIVQTFRQDLNPEAFVLVQPTKWEGVVIGRSVNLNIQQNVETLQTFVNGNLVQENQVVCVQTLNATKVDD